MNAAGYLKNGAVTIAPFSIRHSLPDLGGADRGSYHITAGHQFAIIIHVAVEPLC